jgi:hypothetical protein
LTVCSDIWSRIAISLLPKPPAIMSSTCRSRGVTIFGKRFEI